jgi:ATP-dependent Clp protease ATP-binding subunit ClpB
MAIELSLRYIINRYLFDKVIDLVEVASRLRIEIDFMPMELDVLEYKLRRLKLKQTLKKETGVASKERRENMEKEINKLKHDSAEIKPISKNERSFDCRNKSS